MNSLRVISVIAASFIFISTSIAQSPDEVHEYIQLLEKGDIDSVQQMLPSLVAKYQNDPGVLYLQARITSNGIEAVKLYQSILTNFPSSEWADDALFRIYQYYYAMGLYKTAEQKLNQLKKNYPHSPYIAKKDTEQEVKKSPPPTLETKLPPKNGKYTLQVGAFSTLANAEKQKSMLLSFGQPIEIKSSVRNGRELYLVLVGTFATPEEAKNVGKALKARYDIQSMVVEK